MSRRELLETLSAKELQRHFILYELEPWGDRRIEIMLAQVCQTIANFGQIQVPRSQRRQFKIEDFIFDWFPAPRQSRGLEVWNQLKQLSVGINRRLEKQTDASASVEDRRA